MGHKHAGKNFFRVLLGFDRTSWRQFFNHQSSWSPKGFSSGKAFVAVGHERLCRRLRRPPGEAKEERWRGGDAPSTEGRTESQSPPRLQGEAFGGFLAGLFMGNFHEFPKMGPKQSTIVTICTDGGTFCGFWPWVFQGTLILVTEEQFGVWRVACARGAMLVLVWICNQLNPTGCESGSLSPGRLFEHV